VAVEVKSVFDALRSLGWDVRSESDPAWTWPLARYANRVPGDYLDFLRSFAGCLRSDSRAWFLSRDHFSRSSGTSPYSWNQWEIDSLEAAGGDPEREREIRAFWNSTLPIALGIDGGYSYLGICLSDQRVVFGREPEYERSTEVSASFDEFARAIGRRQVPPAAGGFLRSSTMSS